jgi:predicted nucleotidyltransferase
MKPSKLLEMHRSEICRMVEQNRVRNPRVFGSVLRREDVEGSDLDLLVDPLPGTTLLNLGALQVDLEQLLGVPVDVLTPGDLPPKFRDAVLREAVPV